MVNFVTGATGFIGQRLLVGLNTKSSSEKVRILSRKPHPDYETIVCDLQSESPPIDALAGVDTVFHLAGFTHDRRNDSEVKHLYHTLNVDASVRLVELAIASRVNKFLFVSSVKAAGCALLGKCMTKVDKRGPEGVYGKSKREAELKVLELGRQSGMHVSIVRPSLVYGPGVKGNLALMRRGIEKGWFPPIPETGNRRSLIHVDDLVRALLLVSNNDSANGEIFIATDGKSYSSREIYTAICYALGKSIPQWSVPKCLFKLAANISDGVRYKIDKLLGDEYYSSEKLQSIGFKAQLSLREMNETCF